MQASESDGTKGDAANDAGMGRQVRGWTPPVRGMRGEYATAESDGGSCADAA